MYDVTNMPNSRIIIITGPLDRVWNVDWPSKVAACENVFEHLTAKHSAAFAYRAVYADFLASPWSISDDVSTKKIDNRLAMNVRGGFIRGK